MLIKREEITKQRGFFTVGFTLICQVFSLFSMIGQELQPKNANKQVTLLRHIPPPPTVPSLLTTRLQPLTLPSPPFSPSCLTACCDPSCTSWSPQQTLGVWRRSGVQAWLRLHSSLCTEEAALRVYNYLPLAFSAGSSTVQALAPAWGDALGYTLGD